jgi:hypothetical protein
MTETGTGPINFRTQKNQTRPENSSKNWSKLVITSSEPKTLKIDLDQQNLQMLHKNKL